MKRLHFVLLLVTVTLIVAGAVYAQDEQPRPRSTDAFWQAAYWDNHTLSGEPTLRRTDRSLDFDWGSGSPATVIPQDNFSARWTRYIEVPAPGALYRLTAGSDDGIRVWVDETLLIDQWNDHPVRIFSADISLSPGHHLLKVEYYERGGFAVAHLDWQVVGSSGEGWDAEYYDNRWLDGEPTLRRNDTQINFDWGQGSPGPGLPADGFSARWRDTVEVDGGSYRVHVTSDDGIRVFIDGELILSEWSDHPALSYTADVILAAGKHDVEVEYYENSGFAVARFSLREVSAGGDDAWRGEYYDNRSLSGEPVLVRTDQHLNFVWADSSPAPQVPADRFSVRWTRTLHLAPGTYRFRTQNDDGIRLWVDGQLLIDAWYDQAISGHDATVRLDGAVPVELDYYENGGEAAVILEWEVVEGGGPPPGGGALVDDTHGAFVQGGSGDWQAAAEGYGDHLAWTRNNDYARSDYNWGRWYPDLAPGRYELFVYIPDRYTTTHNARYWISHRDGFTLRVVDQSANGGHWVSLGTYWFRGTDQDYLSLADVTFEPYHSTLVTFDAARWDPR